MPKVFHRQHHDASSSGRRRHFGKVLSLLAVMCASMTVCLVLQSRSSHALGLSLSVTSEVREVRHVSQASQASDLWDGRGPKSCRGPKPDMVIPRLLSVRQWHSSKLRQPESITVVTQLSLERLEMLENQCSVWPDPIAAVAYIPTLNGRIFSPDDASLNGIHLGEAVERVTAFYERLQLQGVCVLDLELASQDFDQESDAALYPVNAARNRALMLAHTQVLLLLDADFVPSPTVLASYKTPEGYAGLVRWLEKPKALVLPAFETTSSGPDGKELALAVAHGGKPLAVQEFHQGRLQIFKYRLFPQGHSPSNYKLWSSREEAYSIKYRKDYEPYVLVSQKWVPWYDERFRGYGHNKIEHIMHLRGLNVSFSVHPSGFVVHVPHKRAASYFASKRGQWEKNGKLYNSRVKKDIKEHRFVPVTSFPQLCNR